MEGCKGWICLDIDGTITNDPHSVPKEVRDCFAGLYKEGWRFVFITGRAFTFARSALSELTFPYLFSVQNGSLLLEMPEIKAIQKCYLPYSVVERLDDLYSDSEEDYLIYSGYEQGDFCYYRPARFSSSMNEHLHLMKKLVQEPWRELISFDELKGRSFPLIKCLGTKQHMESLYKTLSKQEDIHATCIKDPLSKDGFYLNLITDKAASKGNALEFVRGLYPNIPFIAAGDDRNDISMLEKADVAIVMETAPSDMLPLGDIIAKSAAKYGIVDALHKAVRQTGRV